MCLRLRQQLLVHTARSLSFIAKCRKVFGKSEKPDAALRMLQRGEQPL